jgi:hypothetical protein
MITKALVKDQKVITMNKFLTSQDKTPSTGANSHSASQHVSCVLKVKVNFSLEQTMKAQRGSRGIVLLFL